MITDESGYTSGFETYPSPQAQMTGWQPIETAPRDDTNILCVCMKTRPGSEHHLGTMAVDSWKERYKGFGQFNTDCWPATHWMPLPDLPETTEGQP